MKALTWHGKGDMRRSRPAPYAALLFLSSTVYAGRAHMVCDLHPLPALSWSSSIDVIGQSRSSDVLARRLKDVVKAFGRAGQPQAGATTCGKLLLRPDIRRAYWKDADLGLTLGEYNIVYLLASNVGRYVTYRAIYDRLHYEGFIAGAGADGYRGNVRSAIKRIRSKFRSLDPTFDEIENYNSFGYCWKKPD